MHQLSHVLADEIYNRVEAREQLAAAWEEKEEEEEEMKENDQAEFLLREWADLKGEEYGSSEESSNEEYDEEAEIPEEEEDEEEYPFPMSDYDYLANVKGEYDELAVDEETFAEHLYDTDDYYKWYMNYFYHTQIYVHIKSQEQLLYCVDFSFVPHICYSGV